MDLWICHAYKVVIPFKILLVEELTVLWIIGCSVFVVAVLQKRKNEEDEKGKKVSHVLC